MFCKNCGSEVNDNAGFCPNCGAQVGMQYPIQPNRPVEQKTNVLAIVGFVLSFFIAVAGLICSIIGYKNAPQYGGNGKSLATAGIVISIISMVIVVIIYISVFAALGSALSTAY